MTPNTIEQLQEAFTVFSQETLRLETSYRSLQNEFERLHQKLESSTHTFQSIVSSIPEGLIFISSDGSIEWFNPAATHLTGVFFSSPLPFWEYFTDDFFGFSMRIALKEESLRRRIILTLPSSSREVEVSASPVHAKGLILLLRDLTDQRQLEQALARNDRLKELGEMAAALAHEIRNPLGGIQGFASLLHQDLKDIPQLQEMAASIVEGTRTLNRLVTNVLAYARPLELHLTMVDLVRLVEETLFFAKMISSIPCHFEKPSSSLFVQADGELLKMALLNLLQNAFHASPPEGVISLFFREKDDNILLSVSDQGIGVPEETQEKIFLPFFTTKAGGTGLGLSETQKILHAHGGTVEVHSDKGATFTLKVPKYAADRKNITR